MQISGLQPDGLSHSEIRGSQVICTYPRLIAAYHVLHRLREPRHPPDALTFFRHNEKLKKGKTEKPKYSAPQSSNSSILIAHTFSCKLRVVSKIHSVNNLKSLLTVLCVNMSKISSRIGTPTVSGAGLTAPALRLSLSSRKRGE